MSSARVESIVALVAALLAASLVIASTFGGAPIGIPVPLGGPIGIPVPLGSPIGIPAPLNLKIPAKAAEVLIRLTS
jgi:hypothetical protein